MRLAEAKTTQRHLAILIVSLLLTVALNGCALLTQSPTATPESSPLPPSPKGYELYSWQQEGGWYFALLIGTDRIKTAEEIKAAADGATAENPLVVSGGAGTEALLSALEQLPQGAQVFWLGSRVPGFALPGQQVLDAVRDYCELLGVQLAVVK
jgi:ABC-type Fe3+-hydroxamate transport system substrate-binding protein